MSDEMSDSSFPSALDNGQVVYRTITRRADIPDGLPLPSAFYRRRTSDLSGVSVNFDVSVPDGCGAGLTGKKAVLELLTGDVRNLDHFALDVIPNMPNHANIKEVPFWDSENEAEKELAHQIASRLLDISKVAWNK